MIMDIDYDECLVEIESIFGVCLNENYPYPLNNWSEFRDGFWSHTNRWKQDNYEESVWDEYLRLG